MENPIFYRNMEIFVKIFTFVLIYIYLAQFTLLKIKVTKGFFTAMPLKNLFLPPPQKNLSVSRTENIIFYYILIIYRTFFHRTEPFMRWKDSLDVKCSLWNQKDSRREKYHLLNLSTFLLRGFSSWHNVVAKYLIKLDVADPSKLAPVQAGYRALSFP